MRSQIRVREELQFVSEFNTLLEVMQQAAVSQLRRLDSKVANEPMLVETLMREFFPLLPVAARLDTLMRGGAQGRLVVVFTSEEGMVGPLHANVIRRALEHAEPTTQWIMVGGRGMRLLGEQAGRIQFMPMPSEADVSDAMQRLRHAVLTQYTRDGLQQVLLVAPRFISTTHQEVGVSQLLPLPLPQAAAPTTTQDVLVVEPSLGPVLHAVAAMWVEHVCIESFWSTRRAECAARALHVEFSRQELAKQTQQLRHEFFKALHEQVDVEVRETCVIQRVVAHRMAAMKEARPHGR